MNELIEAYLNGNEAMVYVYDRATKEVYVAAAEEEKDGVVLIPQMTADEAYRLMEKFAENQEEAISTDLLEALNGKKPFRSFKAGIIGQDIEEEWYRFENEYAESKMSEWIKQYE